VCIPNGHMSGRHCSFVGSRGHFSVVVVVVVLIRVLADQKSIKALF